MTLDAASAMFAVLALAADGIATVVLLGLAAGPRWSAGERLLGWIRESALGLAWLIATVATLGSLYYSEIAHLPPCTLCWYQRIAMYTLPVVLGIATIRRDRDVWRYVLPVALIGGAIAAYHYVVEWSPALTSGFCTGAVPCDVAWFRTFGFISIPYMALSGFAAIAALMALLATRRRDTDATANDRPTTQTDHEDVHVPA